MPDLDAALALRARAEDLARALIPPVLERVFDALVPEDRHLRLDRLDLDLGIIPAGRLERDLPAALERALGEALAGAIAAARHAPGPAGRFMAPEEALLDRFDSYLATGTTPFDDNGDPVEVLRRLLAGRQAALVERLRRRAADRQALERLVLQIGPGELHGLLSRLAPADASVILAYLAELLRLHRAAPALPLPGPVLERRLWLLTLDYLLRDPGTRFNRRAYLKLLVAGAARAEGIAYGALLLALRAAAVMTRRRRPLGDSLPTLLGELAAELSGGPGEPGMADPTGESPGSDASPVDDAFARAEAGDGAALLALMRHRATDDTAMLALAARLSGPVFGRLLRALEPHHAAPILLCMAELTLLHRAEALLALSESSFEPRLRLVVLRLLLRDAGSRFDRRAWLRRLLRDLAASEELPYARLLTTLARATQRLRARRRPPSGSLSALIRDLADETPAAAPRHAPPAGPLPTGRSLAARALGARTLAALSEILPADSPAAWRRLAGRTAAAERAALLRWLAHDPALLHRFAAALSEQSRDGWLAALDPAARAGARDTVRELRRRHAGRALAPLGGTAFGRLAWALAVQALALALAGGPPMDRNRLRRDLLDRLARHQGVPATGLAVALGWRATGTDPLVQAERFLRDGEPPADGPALAGAMADDPAGFAALLRRLVAADAGRTAALAGRLTAWLLPEDAVECLQPGRTAQAARWAAALAAERRLDEGTAWSMVLGHLLRGEPVPEAPPGSTPAPASGPNGGPDGGPGGGPGGERAALLRHWLDRGALPGWAPPGIPIDSLLDGLTVWPLVEVLALFGDAGTERNAGRLRRAADRRGRAWTEAALRRLAPWVFAPDGPLVRRLGGLAEAGRWNTRLRAAAAVLSGQPFDLDALAAPIEAPAGAGEEEGAMSADRAALLAFLRGDAPAPAHGDRLNRLVAALADDGDAALDRALGEALRAGLGRAEARAGWVAALSDEILARLVRRIEPAWARPLLTLTMVLAGAWRQAAPPDRRADARRLAWAGLLALLDGPRAPTAHAAADRLVTGFVGTGRIGGGQRAADPADTARVLAHARELARGAGYAGLDALLRPRPPRRRPPDRAPKAEARNMGKDEALYVANAGLVLFNPFLPHFLERLGLLTTDEDGIPRVAGTEAASRAVHLLQHLVDGRCDRPETTLVLNKLLCGLALSVPVLRAIEPDAAELAVCDGMIQAVIGNWPIIRNTSPAGLRETFLQREGRLQRDGERWTLQVQRKTVDILTDQIPWNRSIVYHRWMAGPIHVTW